MIARSRDAKTGKEKKKDKNAILSRMITIMGNAHTLLDVPISIKKIKNKAERPYLNF